MGVFILESVLESILESVLASVIESVLESVLERNILGPNVLSCGGCNSWLRRIDTVVVRLGSPEAVTLFRCSHDLHFIN